MRGVRRVMMWGMGSWWWMLGMGGESLGRM